MQLVPGSAASVRLNTTSGTDAKSGPEPDYFSGAENGARAVQYSSDDKDFESKPPEPDLMTFINVGARVVASGTFYVLETGLLKQAEAIEIFQVPRS